MAKKVSIKKPKSKAESPQDWVLSREGMKRLTIDIPMSIHSRLKIASVKHGQTMGVMVRECIDKYLKEKGS